MFKLMVFFFNVICSYVGYFDVYFYNYIEEVFDSFVLDLVFSKSFHSVTLDRKCCRILWFLFFHYCRVSKNTKAKERMKIRKNSSGKYRQSIHKNL